MSVIHTYRGRDSLDFIWMVIAQPVKRCKDAEIQIVIILHNFLCMEARHSQSVVHWVRPTPEILALGDIGGTFERNLTYTNENFEYKQNNVALRPCLMASIHLKKPLHFREI